MPAAEWVVFRDPRDPEWEWHFDVYFLMSGYRCLYGCGCKGTEGVPSLGCCGEGAYIASDGDDAEGRASLEVLKTYVARLGAEDWEHREAGLRDGWWHEVADDAGGGIKTARTHDGSGPCVFANTEGFAGGAGCALHAAALKHGEDPLDWKPDICWQVPMQIETDPEAKLRVVRAFHNYDDWGDGEHEPLDWWCVDDPLAYDAAAPVWISMAKELTRLCGPEIYAALRRYLLERELPIGRVPVNFVDLCIEPDGTTGLIAAEARTKLRAANHHS